MAWVAPEVARHDEPFVGGEREMLRGFLQYGRESLLLRCAGLSSEQLVLRSAPPSSLSLLGLVRHASDVERTWLRRRMARQDVPLLYATPDAPDAAFDGTQAPTRRGGLRPAAGGVGSRRRSRGTHRPGRHL